MAETLSDKRLAAAESAALAPSPAAAPAAPEKPSTLGSGVTGAQAEERMKQLTAPPPAPAAEPKKKGLFGLGFLGLKAGGKVMGPGTSTSDSIPARLSKGEYVLPADTVKKVGAKNLDHLRKSTHNPDNRLPGSAKHAAGSRGMGMKYGGKVK